MHRQDFRSHAVLPFLIISEHNCRSLAVRQCLDAVGDGVSDLILFDGFIGKRAFICTLRNCIVGNKAATAQAIEAGVGGNARQPSGNAAASRLPAICMLPKPQQCLLRDIFRLLPVAEHAIGDPPGDFGMAIGE